MNCKTLFSVLWLFLCLSAQCQTAAPDSLAISIDRFDHATGLLRYTITNSSTHTIAIGRPVAEIGYRSGNIYILQQQDTVTRRIYLLNVQGEFAMYKKMAQEVRHPILIRAGGHIVRHMTIPIGHTTARPGEAMIYLFFSGGMMLYPHRYEGTSYFTGKIVSEGVPARLSWQ